MGEKEARMRGMGRAGGRGLKDGRRPNFRAGARWQGWRRGQWERMEAPGGQELAAGSGRKGPLELRRGWGRGACAGPLPVLGVYHPRWLCSGWEEAARGVGRWTSEWMWGRARGSVSAG